MEDLASRLDWPNLLAGALLGAATSTVAWVVVRLYEYRLAGKGLPYPIWGRWYSAEYDIKADSPRLARNTFLEVRVRPGLRDQVVVTALRPLDHDPDRAETKWQGRGAIVQGDTLVGRWRSTVPNTNRHGTALLKFIDFGRAVGYWTGYGHQGNPGYGYWIMARDQHDLRELAAAVLRDTTFDWTDVVGFVLRQPPPTRTRGCG